MQYLYVLFFPFCINVKQKDEDMDKLVTLFHMMKLVKNVRACPYPYTFNYQTNIYMSHVTILLQYLYMCAHAINSIILSYKLEIFD